MVKVKMTHTVAQVLAVMLEDGGDHYGVGLAKATGIAFGTLYPILARLETAGVTTSRDEEFTSLRQLRRSPRRYYRLTPEGADFASAALAKLDATARCRCAGCSGKS
jgi:PadR family transcriptional regulator, regulatory protein PadR